MFYGFQISEEKEFEFVLKFIFFEDRKEFKGFFKVIWVVEEIVLSCLWLGN